MRPQLSGMLSAVGLAALFVASPAVVVGQEDSGGPAVLEVGALAPDFKIVGATRYGVLRDTVRLNEFRGKTVVLAFFFRARTPG